MTLQNFQIAVRNLRRSRGYCFTAIASLALGIGGAVAMFAIVHAVLLKPLPYREPDRLVRVIGWNPKFPETEAWYLLNAVQFLAYRDGLRTLESLAGFRPGTGNLTGINEATRVNLLYASEEFLRTFGLHIQLGRWFSKEDEAGRGMERVVISDNFWRRALGADPRVIGQTLYLDGQPQQIIGVMPADFWLPSGNDLFPLPIPEGISIFRPLVIPINQRDGRDASFFYRAIGRLSGAATAEQAAQEMTAKMPPTPPSVKFPPPVKILARGMREQLTESSRGSILLLLVAVLFLLMIVCVNVGSLAVMRWNRNERELAVRAALGATWKQLAGLCLAESAVVSSAGTIAGVLLAWSLIDAIRSRTDLAIPRIEFSGLGGPVLLFSLCVGAFSAMIVGLLAAFRVTRNAKGWDLRSGGGRTATPSYTAGRFQRRLISVQTGLAVVLLSGASLLTLSLWKTMQVPEGYDSERVAIAKLNPAPSYFPRANDRLRLAERFTEELRTIRGVTSAAVTTTMPNEPSWNLVNVETDVRPAQADPPVISAHFVFASKGYYETLGIPLLEGSIPEDQKGDERKVVISRSAARAFFPGLNPIGRVLRHGINQWPERVVGVVGDIYADGLDQPPSKVIYRPFAENYFGGQTPEMILLVRTEGDTSKLSGPIREVVRKVTPQLGVPRVETLRQLPRREVTVRQTLAALVSGFGFVALFVAVAGLYGVTAYSLAQRRKEHAIRAALGAEPQHLRVLIWRETLTPVLWGLFPGILGAAAVGPLLRGLLFGVSPFEPWVFVLTPAVLVGAALVPAFLLSRHAKRIDPSAVLQAE